MLQSLYKIITVRLRLSQVLSKMVSTNAHEFAYNAENDFGFGFDFFRAI
jgi:hypothetical protein